MNREDDENYNDGHHSTIAVGTAGIRSRIEASAELIRALRSLGRESCARAAESEHFEKFGEVAV